MGDTHKDRSSRRQDKQKVKWRREPYILILDEESDKKIEGGDDVRRCLSLGIMNSFNSFCIHLQMKFDLHTFFLSKNESVVQVLKAKKVLVDVVERVVVLVVLPFKHLAIKIGSSSQMIHQKMMMIVMMIMSCFGSCEMMLMMMSHIMKLLETH